MYFLLWVAASNTTISNHNSQRSREPFHVLRMITPPAQSFEVTPPTFLRHSEAIAPVRVVLSHEYSKTTRFISKLQQ